LLRCAGRGGERQEPDLDPSADNRCHALAGPTAVSLQHQTVFCLGGRATLCSRYRLAPTPAQSVPAPAPRRLGAGLAIAALAIAAGVGAAVAALAVGNPFDAEPVPSGPAAAATAAAGATGQPATPVPLVIASPAPAPAAIASSAPSPSPTPRPTPAATPALYTVQPGDSLTRLAARFGVSLADLAAANDLAPNAGLQIGQTLHIPPQWAASPTPTLR